MKTKFKLFGYIWDLEVPMLFIGLCFSVTWVFLPMSFDENTPWYMGPIWFIGAILMIMWGMKKKANPEEEDNG